MTHMYKRQLNEKNYQILLDWTKKLHEALCRYRDGEMSFESLVRWIGSGRGGDLDFEPAFYTHFALSLYPSLGDYHFNNADDMERFKEYVDEYVKDMKDENFSPAVAETAMMYEKMIMDLNSHWHDKHRL